MKDLLDSPLAWFIAVLLIGALLLSLFLHGAVSNIKNVIAEHAKIYAISYIKGGCLILIAVGTGFKETFGPITTAQAATFAWWDWVIKFSAPILAGLAVLAAFLDQSVQRANVVKDAKVAASSPSAPPFPIAPVTKPPTIDP